MGHALADIAAPHLRALATVALYVSMPHEPDTGPFRAALLGGGARVLLPWLRDDGDLDWVFDGGTTGGPDPAPRSGSDRRVALRPPGRLLGVTAVTAAAAIVVPALAVDTAGRRLGQGGGSYDRVLARLPAGPAGPQVVACVFDDEVRPAATRPLPEEAHDRRVDVALTPTRWLELRPAGR